MKVSKAVIPVAGLGTRFLPATRSIPKVLIPVFNKPPLHICVEEAVAAGIHDIIVVMSPEQESVVGYFDPKPDIEAVIMQRGNDRLLEETRSIPELAKITYVTQDRPLGLGHAILMAAKIVGGSPFAVLLPDDLIWSKRPTIASMIKIHHQYGGNVIAVKKVPDVDIPNLGIIDPVPVAERIYKISDMVEKPSQEEAPSDLGIVGRYILDPRVFSSIEKSNPGALGEIQLTDAISSLIPEVGAFAYRFPGKHYDVGTPMGLLKASIYTARSNEATSTELYEWLREFIEA